MIKRLKINNFRLIKEVDIALGKGLNVITGETGAGKSMLIDSISMLLGKRTKSDTVRKNADEAIVEAEFIIDEKLAAQFDDGLDVTRLLFRRVINSNGKSKSSINNSARSSSTMREIAAHLIDLHGQHEHQSLLDPKRHGGFIDARGELSVLKEKAQAGYYSTKSAKDALDLLLERKRLAEERRELLSFRMKELSSANPQPGETEEIEEELKLLEHGETLLKKSQELANRLYEQDASLYEILEFIRADLEELSKIDSDLKEQTTEIAGASITLKEVAANLSNYAEKIDLDPARLEHLRERHTLLVSLARKYGGSEEAMLILYDETQQEFDSLESVEGDINKAKELFEAEKAAFSNTCIKLSERRKKAAEILATDVVESMKGLGIENSRFRTEMGRQEAESGWVTDAGTNLFATENGIDDMEFYISTNPGEDLKPLAQVASGGEISRIMLAIKAMLAEKDNIPVLVFDEIDIGISGRVAEAVGERLHELSKYHQIICITHLPQIASKADTHYLVEKNVKEGRTFSTVRELSKAERKEAVASLLAGSEVTDSARKQAEEMLLG